MVDERGRQITKSVREAKARVELETAKKKASRVSTAHWKSLYDEWRETVWKTYGKDTRVSSWTVPEIRLMKMLIREESIEECHGMIRDFVEWYAKTKRGLPSVTYFWKARDSHRKVVRERDTANIGQEERSTTRDEYPTQVKQADLPDVGWE